MNARTIFIVVLLLIGGSWATARGFDLGDIIETKTPIELRQTEGFPKKLSLNDSRIQYKIWLIKVQRIGEQWRSDIEGGEQVLGFLNNLTMQAMEYVGPTIAGIPIIGPLMLPLAGLIGIGIKRRGDITPAQLQAEKEGSYAKGREDAVASGQ